MSEADSTIIESCARGASTGARPLHTREATLSISRPRDGARGGRRNHLLRGCTCCTVKPVHPHPFAADSRFRATPPAFCAADLGRYDATIQVHGCGRDCVLSSRRKPIFWESWGLYVAISRTAWWQSCQSCLQRNSLRGELLTNDKLDMQRDDLPSLGLGLAIGLVAEAERPDLVLC